MNEIDLNELTEAMAYRCRENSGHAVYDIVWDAARAYRANRLVLQDTAQDRAAALEAFKKMLEIGEETPSGSYKGKLYRKGDQWFFFSDKDTSTILNAISTPYIDPKVVEQVAEILNRITEERDVGRHDGKPESAPILSDIEMMWEADKALALLAPFRKSRED